LKTTIKAAAALVAALIPISLASPAFALAIDRYTIEVDCNATLPDGAEEDHNIADGDLLTITFLNCANLDIWDNNNTGNAFLPGGAIIDDSETQLISSNNFVVTVDGETQLEIDTTSIGIDTDWDIDVNMAYDVGNPNSTLLATETLTMPLGVSDMMVRESAIGGPDVLLGENGQCDVEPGEHVYSALDFTVLAGGEFDFRAVNVSPMDEDMYWQVEEYPNSDPFMVLYEGFNPDNPDAGVVGCSDNSDDSSGSAEIAAYWGPADDSLLTGTGYITDDQWPWYRTTLEPGNYSLVIMTPETISTEDFDAGQNGATSGNDDTWDPIAQSTTYEMWGPAGGLRLGHPLADTGVNPAFALWSGLALAGTGVAITVARRRAQRS
jgi:hypothetical protein